MEKKENRFSSLCILPFLLFQIALTWIMTTLLSFLSACLKRQDTNVKNLVFYKDEKEAIQAKFREWIEHPKIQVVLSTDGTGISFRDTRPEAFAAVWEKEIPGFGELFQALS